MGRRDERGAAVPAHRRRAARRRVDEVVPGDDRPAEAPHLDARARDARRPAARGRARVALGRDRCGGRVPRRHGRVRARVGRDLPAHQAGRRAAAGGARARWRPRRSPRRGCSRDEGPRRLRDLAARRRRAGEPRARRRRVPALAWARGRGRDDCGAAPAAEEYPVHWISRVAPEGRHPRAHGGRDRAPRAVGGRRLHDRHVRPQRRRRDARRGGRTS